MRALKIQKRSRKNKNGHTIEKNNKNDDDDHETSTKHDTGKSSAIESSEETTPNVTHTK